RGTMWDLVSVSESANGFTACYAKNTGSNRSLHRTRLRRVGELDVRLRSHPSMSNNGSHKRVQWRSLITDRPDTERRILCAYHSGTEWIMFISIYYPDFHRVYLNRDAWLGD